MKNLFTVLLMLYTFNVMAQNIRVCPGLKLGAINTNISKWRNIKDGFGPNIGVTYSGFYKKIYVSIEPAFARRSFKKDTTINKLNYLELPIVFGYTPLNKKLRLGVNMGISPAYMSMAKNTQDEELTNYNKFNLDALAGGIVGFNISNDFMVDLNLRYGKSLIGNKYTYVSAFINFIFKV